MKVQQKHCSLSFELESFLLSGALVSVDSDTVVLAWGRRRWVADSTECSGPAFYFPDFFLQGTLPWFEQEFSAVLERNFLLSLLDEAKCSTVPSIHWQQIDWGPYEATFLDLQQSISVGDLSKGVAFAKKIASSQMTPQRLLQILFSLLKKIDSSSLYVYGFWDASSGLLGATPELLFVLDEERKILSTVACAGTCASSDVHSLGGDDKIAVEHHIVVQDISERLTPFGCLSVGQRKSMKFSTLTHLVTPITLNMIKSLSFAESIALLHPTPALGAYPREAGARWLQRQQQRQPRMHFGAPAACKLPESHPNKRKTLCLVAIRGIEWDSEKITASAGGGIVAASDLQQEKEEICLKFSAIQAALAL